MMVEAKSMFKRLRNWLRASMSGGARKECDVYPCILRKGMELHAHSPGVIRVVDHQEESEYLINLEEQNDD